MSKTTSTPETTDAPREESTSAWIRYYDPYTPDDVHAMLKGLPKVWDALEWDAYFDHVQQIPTSTKIKVEGEAKGNRQAASFDRYIPTFVLYASVACRYRMLSDLARLNDWRVEFTPEAVGTTVPGLIHDDDFVVYRVTCTIFERVTSSLGGAYERSLGSRTGVSKRPAGDANSFEKAETAATGRAIAAWGIGILPGSGVASAEEIRDITAAERDGGSRPAQGQGRTVDGNTQRESKEELVAQVLELTEQIRQLADLTVEEAMQRNVEYFASVYRLDVADQQGLISWGKVNQGQALQLRNSLRTALQKALAAGQVTP